MNVIRTMLSLYPANSYNKYNRYYKPQPIIFYIEENNIMYLPYLFAASLFQIIPNLNIQHIITNLNFTGTLRDYQIPVEEEAWTHLEKLGTTTLGLRPGFGKTIVSAKLASRIKLLTVVLVNRTILLNQWKYTFETYTNARVWVIDNSSKIPTYYDVIICMDTRWHLIPIEIRNLCGILIIDESHLFFTAGHVKCLLAFPVKYIIMNSATLLRDDELHSMGYALCGEHGVFREINQPFTVMKLNTNTKPVRSFNRQGGVDWTALVAATLMDERRNRIIFEVVRRNLQYKILILTALRDHATLLHDGIDKMGITCDYLCGNKKGYIDSNVLVGTCSKIGTGFDPATSCPTYAGRPFDLLILACSMKKYNMMVQNIGRVFRAEMPYVIHLVDDDDIYRNHWLKARRWYVTHGGTVTEYNIENSDQPHQQSLETKQNLWLQQKVQDLASKSSKS